MFTVLHEREDGRQDMFMAETMEFVPNKAEFAGIAGLHLYGEAGRGVRIGILKEGRAFVMNEDGATVGRFSMTMPSQN